VIVSSKWPAPQPLRPDWFKGHSPHNFENEKMRWGIEFALLLPLIASAGTATPPRHELTAPSSSEKPMPQLMQSCDAHKFETLVTAIVDGQPHQSKVKLCGVEGQSDAAWIKTLQDAINKLEANEEMAPAVRSQIVTAIKAEIARLTIVGSIAPTKSKTVPIGSNAAPLSRDYSSLPSFPSPQETPAAPIQKDFADLPPVPPPPEPVAAASSAVAASSKLIPTVVPRLTFGCDAPGDLSADAPCAAFERETILTVHARDDVPDGILLQFVRNDQPEADVALGGLRKGKAVRVILPAKVCTGFASGKLELRIVQGSAEGTTEPLSSEGPYSLRC
jgi:hypothetical protein